MSARDLALLVTVGALAACQEERLAPLPGPSATVEVPGTGGGGAGTGGAPDPGPKVRDVYHRNPIGLPLDNLLADGDFELSIVSAGQVGGQYGWRAFTSAGQPTMLNAETGGLCKSGLRCGRADALDVLLARGTAAPNGDAHVATIYAKPAAGGPDPASEEPCDLATAWVIRCDTFQTVDSFDPDPSPDADGWCRLSTESEPSTTALCVYVEVGRWPLLLDAATLLPKPPPMKKIAPPRQPTAEQAARMAIVRERVRYSLTAGSKSLPFDPEAREREAREQ